MAPHQSVRYIVEVLTIPIEIGKRQNTAAAAVDSHRLTLWKVINRIFHNSIIISPFVIYPDNDGHLKLLKC